MDYQNREKYWQLVAGRKDDEFLKYCIEYFGETKQQSVCVEEMAELTQQLCKFMIDHPNKSREKVVEEYTDVQIMLNQMRIIFNITDEEVEKVRTFKLSRLKKFIESRKAEEYMREVTDVLPMDEEAG